MAQETSVEKIQKQIDFEIEKFEMDFNNGVEWSMRIMLKSLERIKQKAEQAKAMHKEETMDAFNYGMNCSADYFEAWSKTTEAENYYNETYTK